MIPIISRFLLAFAAMIAGTGGFSLAQERPAEIGRKALQARSADAARLETRSMEAAGATPAEAAGEMQAPKMRGDEEFGEQMILSRRAEVDPWSFSLDAQYFYTDNVALVPEGAVDDFYLRTGLFAQYANRIAGDWFMDVGLSNYFHLHDEHEFFDFHLMRADAGVMRRLPWMSDLFASLHYSWFRISDPDFESSAFQDHTLNVNLQKIWKISRGQQLVMGLGADFSLAPEPAEPGRHEYSGYAAYKLRFTERFSVQAGYRGAFYDYPEVDRQDWNHSLTLGCVYTITDWLSASVSATGSLNRSSASFFDYENIISGVGVSFHIEF